MDHAADFDAEKPGGICQAPWNGSPEIWVNRRRPSHDGEEGQRISSLTGCCSGAMNAFVFFYADVAHVDSS